MRAHPWSLDLRDDPAPGPNAVRHFDQSMRAVAPLALTVGEKFELVTAVDEYVFGCCAMERVNLVDHAPPEWVVEYIDDLLSTGDYPALQALSGEHGTAHTFAAMSEQLADPDRFERNLNRLLDGFGADLRPR